VVLCASHPVVEEQVQEITGNVSSGGVLHSQLFFYSTAQKIAHCSKENSLIAVGFPSRKIVNESSCFTGIEQMGK
jgi:hypothetical protein